VSFFERLLSLKWYFYVFTLGTIYAIFFLIILFPIILNPYRLPSTILLLFILSSGVITFPWIQLAWHGRFGHFTMWWLKSFGRAYVKRNRDAKKAYDRTPEKTVTSAQYNPENNTITYWISYDDSPKKDASFRERNKFSTDYVRYMMVGFVKYVVEDMLILFFGFIIIFFVFTKAFKRADKYGYLKNKYQEGNIKDSNNVSN